MISSKIYVFLPCCVSVILLFNNFKLFFSKTDNDSYCAAEGEWEDTKVNFTAKLKCKNMAGHKTRNCR